MSIYLGNLSVSEIEKRLGIELKQEEKDFFKDIHQGNATDIAKGKWHCYDMPFMIVCGGYELAQEVIDILTPYAEQFKMQIAIGIN